MTPETDFVLYVVFVALAVFLLARFGGPRLIRWYVGSVVDERRVGIGQSLASTVIGSLGVVMMIAAIPAFQADPQAVTLGGLLIGTTAAVLADWLGMHLAVMNYRKSCARSVSETTSDSAQT